MPSETGKPELLEAKAPMLFLVGGVLYGVFVVNGIFTTYAGTSFEQATAFAAVGKVLVPLGLLGLYPALVERRPYLSRAAAAMTVIPIACWSLVFVGEIIKAAGILSEAPGPLALTPLVGFFGLYVAFGLFGIAALLVDVHPRAASALLVLYPAMVPLWLTVLSGVPDFVTGVVAVVVFSGLGIALWNADVPTTEAEPAAEPTA